MTLLKYFFSQIAKALSILALGTLLACSSGGKKQSDGPEKITIAVAANMQFAMDELMVAFEKATGIRSEQVVSSSGKLTAQIMEGAPFDVLVSADMKYPAELYKVEMGISTPKVYAYGKLVLWSMADDIEPSLQKLSDPSVRHIAVANPKTAPYGAAAIEVLDSLGLLEKLGPKLVFGESIAQTNQFIVSRSTELGFTAMSVVLSPEMKGKGKWVAIDESMYSPIAQGAVAIKSNSNREVAANKFCDFLASSAAQDILVRYGYSVGYSQINNK